MIYYGPWNPNVVTSTGNGEVFCGVQLGRAFLIPIHGSVVSIVIPALVTLFIGSYRV